MKVSFFQAMFLIAMIFFSKSYCMEDQYSLSESEEVVESYHEGNVIKLRRTSKNERRAK